MKTEDGGREDEIKTYPRSSPSPLPLPRFVWSGHPLSFLPCPGRKDVPPPLLVDLPSSPARQKGNLLRSKTKKTLSGRSKTSVFGEEELQEREYFARPAGSLFCLLQRRRREAGRKEGRKGEGRTEEERGEGQSRSFPSSCLPMGLPRFLRARLTLTGREKGGGGLIAAS